MPGGLDRPMTFHSLSFRAFAQATEDEEKVARALRLASGAEGLDRSVSEGYHGNRIVVLHAEVKAAKRVRGFFRALGVEDLRRLLDTLDSRVDDDCTFYLRLDKQEAFLGRLVMLETGDVISVSGKIESYPKRRETAMANVRSFLEGEVAERAR